VNGFVIVASNKCRIPAIPKRAPVMPMVPLSYFVVAIKGIVAVPAATAPVKVAAAEVAAVPREATAGPIGTATPGNNAREEPANNTIPAPAEYRESNSGK
jgi:hypothetical protein